VQDGAAWKSVPDDKLFVIDLAASPPQLIDTLTVGKRPSGLSISRKGDLALVANCVGKSVSVLSIQGGMAKAVGEVRGSRSHPTASGRWRHCSRERTPNPLTGITPREDTRR
jgi:hypothetical protein